MNWNEVVPELVLDRDLQNNLLTERFSWEKFLDSCGGHASRERILFSHVEFIEQTVLQRIAPPRTMLFVRTRENGVRLARVETSVEDQLCVDFADVPHGDREWITADDIVSDDAEFSKAKSNCSTYIPPEAKFISTSHVKKYIACMGNTLGELVTTGNMFELQDRNSPDQVLVARVLESHGGIVVAETLDAYSSPSSPFVINIADPLCHPMGWAKSGAQEVKYMRNYSGETLSKWEAIAVPDIVFGFKEILPHKLEINNLLEVQDLGIGTSISYYPAHVSELINKHYCIVQANNSKCEEKPFEIIITRSTPGVYPMGYSSSHRMAVKPPPYMENTLDSNLFSWQQYKEEFRITNAQAASEECFEPPPKKKISCLEYIELFCYEQGTMTSAFIVRSKRDTIWVVPGFDVNYPGFLSLKIGGLHFFPCGFSKRYRIPFVAPPPFFTLPELDSSPDSNGEVKTRFDMGRHYRSVPGPVFRKFTYSGRGRPEKKWTFMTDAWLKGDKWLPNLYLNRSCKLGQWFDHNTFNSLKANYSAGPLPHVIREIIKDFYRCCKNSHRQDFLSLLNTDSDVPVVVVKYRWRAEHVSINVPVCETARQFAGWIRNILQALGCCSNLISFNPKGMCQEDCCKKNQRNRGSSSPAKRNSSQSPLKIDQSPRETRASQILKRRKGKRSFDEEPPIPVKIVPPVNGISMAKGPEPLAQSLDEPSTSKSLLPNNEITAVNNGNGVPTMNSSKEKKAPLSELRRVLQEHPSSSVPPRTDANAMNPRPLGVDIRRTSSETRMSDMHSKAVEEVQMFVQANKLTFSHLFALSDQQLSVLPGINSSLLSTISKLRATIKPK